MAFRWWANDANARLSAILIVFPLIKKKRCQMAKLSGSVHGGLYIDDAHVDPRIVH